MDFIVSNLNDSGSGSLRWAIDQANTNHGFDNIRFQPSLAGGTLVLRSSLSEIKDKVAIQGLVSNQNAPQVAIDFNSQKGLKFSGSSANGSSIKGLALLKASGDGLTLDASNISVQNNYIGIKLDGITGNGNTGNGILITNKSTGNLIGTLDPLTGADLAKQVSNVISSNFANGILVQGSSSNRIANNRIGTSADGKRDLGNKSNGICLSQKALNNIIGGSYNSGNSPTKNQFARPGQGNLISGNGGAGVRIDNYSTGNTLLGNFIGTDSKGTAAVGNDGDGVSIYNSDGNILRGTTRNEAPFIYFNVVSGNKGNGLRVQNSNNTVVHANFFGLGADNATIVANNGDGALIAGTSTNTQYGGVIPLGNVNAGNDGNGIAVTDQAKKFISFNTFAGLTAFGGIAPNKKSGIMITSSGGQNEVRTNVMAGNLMHGLHVTGNAKDVWIEPNIIGLDSYGTAATYKSKDGKKTISWANGVDGIRVEGSASNIRITGDRKSVIPQNTISNNKGYGIRLLDRANQITIDNAYIGLSSTGKTIFGNNLGGIYADDKVSGLQIGTQDNLNFYNRIVGNGGNGITLTRPINVKMFNNKMANNGGNGLSLSGGSGNTIANNQANANKLYGFKYIATTRNTIKNNTGVDNGLGLTNLTSMFPFQTRWPIR